MKYKIEINQASEVKEKQKIIEKHLEKIKDNCETISTHKSKLDTQILPYASVLQGSSSAKMISEEQRRLEKLNFSSNIGYTVKAALLRAQDEDRVITGLSAAVKSLSKTPSDALFCMIAPPAAGDYATHMQEVLLQAYCFENDIYIVKVSFTLYFYTFLFLIENVYFFYLSIKSV